MEIPIKYFWFSLKSILISHLNHSNRIRNEQVMAKLRKLVKVGNRVAVLPVELSSSSTGRTLSSTGRTWPKMTSNDILPVELQLYR